MQQLEPPTNSKCLVENKPATKQRQTFVKLFPYSEPADLDTLWISFLQMDSVMDDNLEKLMLIMNPSSEDDDSVSPFDVECLKFIATTETIVSNVHNLRFMCEQYEEHKKAFNGFHECKFSFQSEQVNRDLISAIFISSK